MKKSEYLPFFIPFIIILSSFFVSNLINKLNNNRLMDKSFLEFTNWMRNHKYSEEIIDIYKCNYRNPVLKQIIYDYMRIRKGELRSPYESSLGYGSFKNSEGVSLNIIEVIPTDKNVEFTRLTQKLSLNSINILTRDSAKI